MRRAWIVFCATMLIAGLSAGCATKNALESTRMSLDKAKAAGAEKNAAYEYYMGEAYLGKAVQQAELGDTKQAGIFNKQAADYSAKALGMAKGGAK
jgi:hypothetical protein